MDALLQVQRDEHGEELEIRDRRPVSHQPPPPAERRLEPAEAGVEEAKRGGACVRVLGEDRVLQPGDQIVPDLRDDRVDARSLLGLVPRSARRARVAGSMCTTAPSTMSSGSAVGASTQSIS